MKQTSSLTRRLADSQTARQTTDFSDGVLHSAIRYRLYVGCVALAGLVATVARYFDGATILPSTGVWQGQVEHCCSVVEILGQPQDANTTRELCRAICRVHHQTSVYLTTEAITLQDIRDTATPTVPQTVA